MIDWNGIARRMAESLSARRAARDFSDVDVQRLSGNLHDIKGRAEAVLEKLDDLQLDEGDRHTTLSEMRDIDLDNETSIGYNLDMIEQLAGAFRYM